MDAKSSGLTFEAAGHVYWRGGRRVPNVTRVLEAVGLSDFGDVNPLVLALAQVRGTAVHLCTALDDRADLDESSVDPELTGYLAAWRKFSRETHHEWTFIEEMAFHPRYEYATTADRIGLMFGNPAVVEIKSGPPQPATGPQTAAQAHCFFPSGVADRSVRRYGCHLRADGTYSLIEYKDRTDFGAFLSALTLYNWKNNHAK